MKQKIEVKFLIFFIKYKFRTISYLVIFTVKLNFCSNLLSNSQIENYKKS